MAQIELVMPKMGESIMEATIIKWLKQPGDAVEAEETILEIATDKVDSEVPAPEDGVIVELRFKEDDVVPVGEVIAIIETEAAAAEATPPAPQPEAQPEPPAQPQTQPVQETPPTPPAPQPEHREVAVAESANAGANSTLTASLLAQPIQGRFYSPLVLNIAREEGITMDVLDRIPGSGNEGRVTKKDILQYVEARKNGGTTEQPQVTTPPQPHVQQPEAPQLQVTPPPTPEVQTSEPKEEVKPAAEVHTEKRSVGGQEVGGIKPKTFSITGEYEIVQMDRMRKMIAENMVYSKHVSPHVTSFVEADVTSIVTWRQRNKKAFQDKHGEKLTFTPIFIEAVAKALKDYPMVNIAVDGDKILVRKNINVGMAVALPSGNLIVPSIKDADQLSLAGIAKGVNDLTERARNGKLKPEDIEGATYTLSNVGTFGNVMGTPIIMQPQCAVLAVGAIQKKPAVIETPSGDLIGIRHMMFLSHSYDHRVIDGALGGSFVRKVADYLEAFDPNRDV